MFRRNTEIRCIISQFLVNILHGYIRDIFQLWMQRGCLRPCLRSAPIYPHVYPDIPPYTWCGKCHSSSSNGRLVKSSILNSLYCIPTPNLVCWIPYKSQWNTQCSARCLLARFPNPLATGHSWQLGNLTKCLPAYIHTVWTTPYNSKQKPSMNNPITRFFSSYSRSHFSAGRLLLKKELIVSFQKYSAVMQF